MSRAVPLLTLWVFEAFYRANITFTLRQNSLYFSECNERATSTQIY
jgi:hypothetical protein